MAMQRQIDQKVVSHACAKAQCKWDKLMIVVEQCPPLLKLTSVKLTLKQLLQLLNFNVWGVVNVPQDATSWMEKAEDLQEMIQCTCFAYA